MSALNLIRYSVAYVFIVSGLMKLLSEELGNTFIGLGLPFPIYFMYVVALTEIVCGGLILANKHVKSASIPLILIMIAAIILTKLPILHAGLIEFAFNARLDIVMLALLAILYKGFHR
jgi:putative oxidoreductase